MQVEGESLQQQKHDMAQQLGAAQVLVSDLQTDVESLKVKLNEAQSSTGWVLCYYIDVTMLLLRCR